MEMRRVDREPADRGRVNRERVDRERVVRRRVGKTGALAVLVVTLLVGLTACAANTSAAASCLPETRSGPLVVEGDPWSGYAPFRPAGNLLPGRLQYKEQLDQAVRACDVSSGRADFEVTTIGQYLRNKPDGSIVGVIDQSQGADALVLNTHDIPYLKSIDFVPKLVAEYAKKGQKPVLAYTGNSPSEELMNELSATFEDFKPTDFTLVSVDQSAAALKMLQNHEAQLAIVWEPDTTTARNDGDVVAYSSKDVPNSIVDVLVARNSLITSDPAAVQQVVDAYYGFMDEKLAHPAELTTFIAADGGLKPAEATSVLDGIKLYGAADADAFMNRNLFPLDEPQVRQSVKAIGSLLALSDPSLVLRDDMVRGSFVAQTASQKKK